MSLLSRVLAPLAVLGRTLAYPLQLRARRNVLRKSGWVELLLEGEVVELQAPQPWAQQLMRRALRQREVQRVRLDRLRTLVRELASDPFARGVLVRLGPLESGWASAATLGQLLVRLAEADKKVLVHLGHHAGNKELLVAAGATRMVLPPAGSMAATGAASRGVFLRDTLAHLGVRVEVVAMGKYKSAPDQLQRAARSEPDREQTQALVDALDDALLTALERARGVDRQAATALVDAAPLLGAHAVARGAADGLARDEDLPEEVRRMAGAEEPPELVPASRYLEARRVPPPLVLPRKKVGVIEVHGPITDRAPPYAQLQGKAAVERTVIADLRAALRDRSVGAVVLHVDSRGGSATASDAIFSAARRVDRDKPVIACFGDFAASGGYYVACGARAIYASPFTITGSIGVFAMLPTWPELAARLGVGHDVLKNRRHAELYDPWRGLDERSREKLQEELGAMYEVFLGVVAEARRLSRDGAHEVAQGRVWVGSAARERGLLDGLGGMEEALQRARDEAGGRFELEPTLVRAHRPEPRPAPPKEREPEALVRAALSLLGAELGAEASLLLEALTLRLGAPRTDRALAWAPLALA